jgi:hypothetical protein
MLHETVTMFQMFHMFDFNRFQVRRCENPLRGCEYRIVQVFSLSHRDRVNRERNRPSMHIESLMHAPAACISSVVLSMPPTFTPVNYNNATLPHIPASSL